MMERIEYLKKEIELLKSDREYLRLQQKKISESLEKSHKAEECCREELRSLEAIVNTEGRLNKTDKTEQAVSRLVAGVMLFRDFLREEAKQHGWKLEPVFVRIDRQFYDHIQQHVEALNASYLKTSDSNPSDSGNPIF